MKKEGSGWSRGFFSQHKGFQVKKKDKRGDTSSEASLRSFDMTHWIKKSMVTNLGNEQAEFFPKG